MDKKSAEDLASAERLLAVEEARLKGIPDIPIEEFELNMREAIARGANLV